jgi:hypothetical protein
LREVLDATSLDEQWVDGAWEVLRGAGHISGKVEACDSEGFEKMMAMWRQQRQQ